MSAGSGISFDHLDRLSDRRGLYEHADGLVRRVEHGYCVDDNARLLVVCCREPDTGVPGRLARIALDVVLDAQDHEGRSRNRMDQTGRWTDDAGTDDCWGRGMWALGVAAARHPDHAMRHRARKGFELGLRQRSTWPRAMAFAALGAAEVVAGDPDHEPTRRLLADTLDIIGPAPSGAWRWPEPRLRYANATLAEAVIAAGAALGRPADLQRGLALLAWLLTTETHLGHLSVTGVDGRGPHDHDPQFDQQAIEVSAMADACWRAHQLTGDQTWSRGIALAAGWFHGDNDTGEIMWDASSGGGYDGLQPTGVNRNEGAESTLALVSTMQRARSFAVAS